MKWVGYPDATYVQRKQLLEDCSHPEILQQIEDAVERCRLSNPRVVADEDPDMEVEGTLANGDKTATDAAAPTEELGRGRRERKAVMRYSPTNLVEYWDELDDLMEDISKHAALAAEAEAGQVV